MLCSIAPFGQTGPYRDFVADDTVLTALGGMLYVNGTVHADVISVTTDAQDSTLLDVVLPSDGSVGGRAVQRASIAVPWCFDVIIQEDL